MQGSTGGLAATGGCLQHRTSGLAVQLARSKVLQQEVIDLQAHMLRACSQEHHTSISVHIPHKNLKSLVPPFLGDEPTRNATGSNPALQPNRNP